MRFVPLIGVVLFVGVGLVWRAWLQKRRYGTSGVVLFRSGRTAQTFRELLLVLLVLALATEAVLAAIRPADLERAYLFTPMQLLGAILVLGGIAMTTLAQLDMGPSWRVGVDETARPGLVLRGLYRFSRNPIYVGMIVTIAGFALLVPTAVTWVMLVATVAGIRRQVLGEEDYLARTYGDSYRDYARRVGRFVPGLGLGLGLSR
jgi:protein-S-isoprenylcysteine O-methyltransferase Ste14